MKQVYIVGLFIEEHGGDHDQLIDVTSEWFTNKRDAIKHARKILKGAHDDPSRYDVYADYQHPVYYAILDARELTDIGDWGTFIQTDRYEGSNPTKHTKSIKW